MFESQKDREKIKNIFKNISYQEEGLAPLFKKILEKNEPIGLYFATEDQTDVSWVFGADEVGRMLGGIKKLQNITKELLPTEKDLEEYIIFAILKKVGPIYAIKLEKALLTEAFS